MLLLRLMFVDRGGSAAERKARVEGMRENEKEMERRMRERIMVFVWAWMGGRLHIVTVEHDNAKRE